MDGLTTAAAKTYHAAHGYNEISEKRPSLVATLAKKLVSPISGMLVLAALLSLAGGKDFDGIFILVLLAVNVIVTAWQEHKADTAIAALNEHLAVMVKTRRDGAWQKIPARLLVPGDVIELAAGDLMPADGTVRRATVASANEASLTGESLPKEKKEGDTLYSGSFLASGLATAEVSAIGDATAFGKTLAKAAVPRGRSALEKDILRITRFLSLASLVAVAVLTAVLVADQASWLDVLRLDLSLVIAGIPVSLPTVMTLIIALGVVALAGKEVVVRRLSSLEELANTDLLLTDKTGTLTKNRITVHEAVPYAASEEELRRLGAIAAAQEPDQALNQALLAGRSEGEVRVRHYIPADSERKRSTMTFEEDGRLRTFALGAPQVIAGLSALSGEARERFDADVERLAKGGYRTLALAAADGEAEQEMTMLGLFALSDELREDAKEVIRFLDDNGIEVAMVTGDNRAIAAEIARELHLPGSKVWTREDLVAQGFDAIDAAAFRDAQAFAEILPEDKLALVEAARRSYTVAANGDGVNDLPAVRAASVGFAVKNAVAALKGAADIVLLSDGIGVMKDAFIEGRRIFARLYVYSLYRVSESFRLIVTIVVLGIATGTYPLTPLELILLALLNDIPIISLATDRVKVAHRPAKINVRRQFAQSLAYGAVGVIESLALFFVVRAAGVPLPIIETLFFLKLTVSGHLLIYVAHTEERWWRYLPSRAVIIATSATQALATLLALTGVLMPASLPPALALLVWVWAFLFMQAAELVKRPAARPSAAVAPSAA